MKILRLSTFLDFGGVETRLANISHVEDDNEWIFVCMNRDGKASEIIKRNKKRVINLSVKPTIYSVITFLKIYRLLKKEKPNVIHTSGAEANFHGILAAKLAGVECIIGEEIGTPNHSKKAKFIFSKIYKFADFVVGNSAAVLKVVHEIDSVPYSKLIKVANPIIFRELPSAVQRSAGESDFRIVMISRLEPVKNIAGVLNVLHRLVAENIKVKLTIAGTGSLENNLKSKVDELGLSKNVNLVGLISDPYPYLVDSDLYILNSYTEGFSNSLIEAMYSKTPSLSTNVGAAPEIINDYESGFLIPVDDEDALYDKIKFIASLSDEDRKKIGQRGQAKVIEAFSLQKHVEKLTEIYSTSRNV